MTNVMFGNVAGLKNRDFLQVKNWMSPDPYCILHGKTIQEAAEQMEYLKIDCLPVINENHHFIGMITLKKIFSYLIHEGNRNRLLDELLIENIDSVRSDQLILDVFSMPYDQLPVLDHQGAVIGVLTKRDILDGLSKYINKLEQGQNAAEALNAILESAYEGIAVVDEHGIIQEINDSYCRFLGIKRAEAIGRHVTEVIDNTHLHHTISTGIPERGVLQKIQGQDMMVHRIPIWREGKVVGAIGMLIFEGVTEIYKIYESLQENQLKKQSKQEPVSLQKEKDSRITLDDIIGKSEEILSVKRIARRAARTSATVLITGESGTGKEMFAKSIHHLSPYSKGPFISVNCGAIPENLFESELFGYEDGAFTGAKKGGKPGKFELANDGTIFLDELGEMPLLMQTKLLRVLQEKEVERVGGVKKYPLNVRIIGATNRNLLEMVDKGEFREDLYYRLNIIQLAIPPLRERKKDIPLLMAYYVKVVCDKYRIPGKSFTAEAVSAFMNYQWRGNIRELVNTIERLVTLVEAQTIDLIHLPTDMLEEARSTIEKSHSNEVGVATLLEMNKITNHSLSVMEQAKLYGDQKEKELILNALRSSGGNKSRAAELLGIHRTTLYQKLRKFHIK